MPTGRYTFDNDPDPDEIDPFGSGTADLDVQLAGIEIAQVLAQNKLRYGLNEKIGLTKLEDAGLMVLSPSGFFQVRNVYRVEVGWMHAKSGGIERLESMVQTADDPSDKTAWFVGVSFPLVSDKIRQLLRRLR